MTISISDRGYIIIHTQNGDFHFSEEEGGNTRIVMYDHFTLEVIGKHKQCPFVVLDSDEFQTRLEVKETEHKWLKK